MVNNKLRSRIKELGVTQNDLADILGVTYQTISAKMNGRGQFNQDEIRRLIGVLNIKDEEIKEIFFSLDNTETL